MDRTGPWTAQRLRSVLKEHLQGERVVILANREPYIHERDGRQRPRAASGERAGHRARARHARLLGRVGRARQRSAPTARRWTRKDRVRVPPGEESYVVRRVWLTEAEENGYYYGFSNEGLWPLCHVAHARPIFRAEDWEHYVGGQPAVRRRGVRGGRLGRSDRARAGLSLRARAADDPRAPAARDDHHVLAHPVAERRALRHLPVARGADLGAARLEHRRLPHAAALQQLHRLGRRVRGEPHRSRGERRRPGSAQDARARRIRSRSSGRCTGSSSVPAASAMPRGGAQRARARARRAARRRRRSPRLHQGHRGAPARGRHAARRSTRSFAAASPSCSSRRRAARRSSATASSTSASRRSPARSTRSGGADGYRPIVLLRAHHEPPTVFRYYRAADLCYVSSLHDGMNLVAKEFVAARDDEPACSC